MPLTELAQMRVLALATMAAALRPGGWLLVEDADTALQPLACLDDSGPAQRRANRLRDAVRELLTRRGADLRYGRTLPRALREAGLVDVAAAGRDGQLAVRHPFHPAALQHDVIWDREPDDPVIIIFGGIPIICPKCWRE